MTLLCLAAIWLVGFAMVRWMFPRAVRWSLQNVWLFSLGIGAGAGVASCLYFLVLLLAGPRVTVLVASSGAAIAMPLAIGVALVILAAGLLTRRKGTELQWSHGPAVPWYLTAFLLLAALLAVTMFLGAVIYNPHGDEAAWSVWNLRARFLFRAAGFWRDAFSSDLTWSHTDYPLLLPGLVALCWKLAGQESTDAPIAIAFLFAAGTAGLLVTTLGALRGKAYAWLAGTVLLGTPGYVALSAALYGDVPLSFYILATLALLCLQDRHPQDLHPQDLRFTALAGLMAGFAAWTRNDGMMFLVALIVARVFAVFRFGQRARLGPQLLLFLAGLAAPLAVVIAFRLRVAGPSGLLSQPASAIVKHLADPARWIVIAQGLVVVLFTFGRFLIPMILVLALFWYLVRFQVDARDRAALATAGIALALTLAIQLSVDLFYVDNLPIEIGTSFERVLLQLWPAALLTFFLASGPLQLVASNSQGKLSKEKKAGRPQRRAVETR
ncbi:MAG: hypothetical protein ABSE57_21475 [Bryobacteraceae bacterium]